MKPILSALLFFAAATAAASPPTLGLPAEVRPANGYARLSPKTDAVSVVYVALDGVYPFPSEELRDPRRFVLPAAGLSVGRYRFVAVAASKTGEQTQGEFVVVVERGGTPVPDPKPKDPPPPPADGKFYFLVVRPDGPAPPAFTAAMGLPEWDTLRAAGHKVKDKTAAESKLLNVIVPDNQLPAVVTLRTAADGETSTIVRPAVPLPTTGAGVLDLPKGVR